MLRQPNPARTDIHYKESSVRMKARIVTILPATATRFTSFQAGRRAAHLVLEPICVYIHAQLPSLARLVETILI